MKVAIKKFYDSYQIISEDFKAGLIVHLFMMVFGFLLSCTVVFTNCMPFGTAFCAAQRKEFTISASLGAALGYLLFTTSEQKAGYIGSLLIAVAVKWVLLHIFVRRNSPKLSAISSAIGTFFAAIMLIIFGNFSSENIIQYLIEFLLATGSSYFIASFLPMLTSKKPLTRLYSHQLCALVITLAILLISVSPFDILGYSPVRLFALVCVLAAACFGGVSHGAITGIVLGFAMSITNEGLFFIVGAFALAGLFAGVFAQMGKVLSAVAFFAGNLIVLLGLSANVNIVPFLTETALAGVVFLVLPRTLNRTLNEMFAPSPQLTRVDSMRKNIVMRLKFASNALTEVSETVDIVAGELSRKDLPEITEVFTKTEDAACNSCGLRLHCFETSKQKTYESFLKMTRQMRRKGKLKPDEYDEKWFNRCINPQVVVESLYDEFLIFESKRQAVKRVAEIRSVVADQMDGLSDMLYDMASEFNESERYDTETASRVDAMLRTMGIVSTDVSCKIDRRQRMTLEICALRMNEKTISRLQLVNRLSSLCNRNFDVPSVVNGSSKMMITVTEKTNFCVNVGVAQYSCKENKLCGDSYTSFNDGRGNFLMILSDGMGSGGRAAVDSAMVSNLIGKLIKSGFGFECSLRLVNSAMMFKSTDESLATVDIACVDLYSGQADFYKAGTPETIVLKGKKAGRAKCSAFPAGILREIKFDKTSTVLEKKNIILMFSDGVVEDEKEPWIEDALKNHRNASPQQIAEQIATLAKRRRTAKHEDDITVMVGILDEEL